MTVVLNYAPPMGSPLATQDTVAFERLDFSADAMNVDLGGHTRTPRRVWITEAVIGWYFWLEVRARRVWRCRPVITTRDRYEQTKDEADTAGWFRGYRHAIDRSQARPGDFSQGRNGQMNLLRGVLDREGPAALVGRVREWTPIGGAR